MATESVRPALPALSRRARTRGLWLAGTVGAATLLLGLLSTPHPKHYPVVVAVHALPAGTVVAASDVQLASWTTPLPGAVTALSGIVGHVLAQPVVAHQPVMAADLSTVQTVQGLHPGEVGVMIPVSLASSDAVQPGTRVAVIWLGAASTGEKAPQGPAAGTILASGLRVLQVLNQNGGPVQPYSAGGINASTPAAVELAVPSNLAGAIAVAAQANRVWLARDPWATTAQGGTAVPTVPASGSGAPSPPVPGTPTPPSPAPASAAPAAPSAAPSAAPRTP